LTSVDLPAPLSPTERGDLARVDGEVDVVQDVHGAEALVDAAHLEDGLLRHDSPPGQRLGESWGRIAAVAYVPSTSAPGGRRADVLGC
jgi:hypothetical protein